MRARLRIGGARDRAAVALAATSVGVAFLVFVAPTLPADTVSAIAHWRFEAATAALMVGLGVLLVQRWPGIAYPVLAAASMGISGSIESAWQASRSFAAFSDISPPGNPDLALIVLAVLARTAVPAAILTLYAAAPERCLGRWVAVVGWGISLASVGGAFLRLGRELDEMAGISSMGFLHELSFQLDEPIPLLILASLGALGSLRASALEDVPAPASVPATTSAATSTGPSRPLLAATVIAAALWLPATIAFLNRPLAIDDGEGTSRAIFVPILAALIGIVAERWSRIVAWCALAVAFEFIGYLVFARGVADYVAYALTLPLGSEAPITAPFALMAAAATLIVPFGFASISLALRASVDGAAPERTWAVRGAVAGLAIIGWFIAGAVLGSGLPVIFGAVLLPLFAIPIAVALGARRRVVPAMAEAERVAMNPFRPLRYLETAVAEALTSRAEHERRAVDAERERLGSELNELQEAMRRLLSDSRLVLEPSPSGATLRATRPPSDLPRPSDREIDVITLLARGASNDEIARELVLSLKTVETHLRRLFGRYDLGNRTELAVLAVREGWVERS